MKRLEMIDMASEEDQSTPLPHDIHCPMCGRFARLGTVRDWFNGEYICTSAMIHCSQCGTNKEQWV